MSQQRGPAAVSSSVTSGDQSGVTPTSQMNGVMTSQSRDPAERSTAAAGAAVHAGDVIKSSLAGGAQDEAGAVDDTAAQQNEISSAAAVSNQ